MSVLSNPGHHPLAIAPLAITPLNTIPIVKGTQRTLQGGRGLTSQKT